MPTTVPASVNDVEAGRARDAEVGDVDAALVVEQQVRRLDVAVDDPARVRGVERGRGLARATSSARPGGCAPSRASRSASEPPARYSMTMYGRPSCSPTSKIVTVFGAFESRAAASASRVKRPRTASSSAKCSASTFTATVRAELRVLGAVDLAHAAAGDPLGLLGSGAAGGRRRSPCPAARLTSGRKRRHELKVR